ncbi:prephenate dehydratase [Alienimonas chondri]|uniref:prephenate dehydratase n=1 Tax=Alienimonas chondri TaxID=2681879 RepID=UPI0014898F67|nr:prephenate dehydratase [Alienimonas chondri]
MDALIAANAGPLPDSVLTSIGRELLAAHRNRLAPVRVAYLGPEHSFSHQAAVLRFGETTDLCPVATIGAVFESVAKGETAYGLVPVENSTDGRVVDTLAAFARFAGVDDHPVRICGEVPLPIHLHLMSAGPRSAVRRVYSKPQALSQCRGWLAEHLPQAEALPESSTAAAAARAKTEAGAAAVGGERLAVEHGLTILASEIEDNPRNVTRFAVLGTEPAAATGDDRTALLLRIPHEPGSLADTLAVFARHEVNLSLIESFPLPGGEPGYQFFLDCDGHADDPAIAACLRSLGRVAKSVTVLGSYPRERN